MKIPKRHLVSLAGSFWAIAGTLLLLAGGQHLPAPDTLPGLAPFAVGLGLGLLKGRLLMRPFAGRNIDRIHALPDRGHPWQIFSPRSWMFVGAMILLGMVLRYSSAQLPGGEFTMGMVDLAVGTGLLVSSTRYLQVACPVQDRALSEDD